MTQVDDYDLKILTLLQSNGRLTNQELSDLVGLSASQCSRRRINLEQANLILGYHARLSPDAVGLGMVGLIEVRLKNHTPDYEESFHRMVEQEAAIVDGRCRLSVKSRSGRSRCAERTDQPVGRRSPECGPR